jgi:hypothetical protein
MSQDTQEDGQLESWEDEGGHLKDEPTQKTLKGHTIPVPSRKAVMDAFRKITEPDELEDEKPEKV